jgi:hypothetical protein
MQVVGMKTTRFLTVGDPDAFLDYPKKAQPVQHHPEWTVECPACKGHGGWNLRVNAYPLHHYRDTPENRHLHAHFRAGCNQCYGWGWVAPENAVCVHDFSRVLSIRECAERNIPHNGACWHVYECVKCGKTMAQDSSD